MYVFWQLEITFQTEICSFFAGKQGLLNKYPLMRASNDIFQIITLFHREPRTILDKEPLFHNSTDFPSQKWPFCGNKVNALIITTLGSNDTPILGN